jgi:hypothetical protein
MIEVLTDVVVVVVRKVEVDEVTVEDVDIVVAVVVCVTVVEGEVIVSGTKFELTLLEVSATQNIWGPIGMFVPTTIVPIASPLLLASVCPTQRPV